MKKIFLLPFILGTIAHAETPTIQKIAPIKLVQNVRGTGKVSVVLDKQKDIGVNVNAKFYQGHVQVRSARYPAAASEKNGILKITFPGKITGSRKSRQRLFTLKISNKVKISSVPSSALSEKSCANTSQPKKHSVVQAAQAAVELTRVITISTFADAEWKYIYGTDSDFQIASIINTAEAIYNAQLGIRFSIVLQNTIADSTPEIDPGQILSTFRQNTKDVQTNLKHLFTGKDMTGSTVGIAYIGAICYAPSYAHGVTQHYGNLTANIFAHEIGHNLGAQHDVSSYGSLMYPSISVGTAYFSSYSVAQINTHLQSFGSCIEQKNLSPSLQGATLTIKKTKKGATFTLLSARATPIQEQLSIKIGKSKRIIRITSTNGTVFVRVKQKGRVKILANVVNNADVSAKSVFKF